VNGLLARFGISLPGAPELISAVAALIVIALAWLVAGFAGRRAGPKLARLWERHAGVRNAGIGDRMCAMLRYLVASLLLALAIVIEPWLDLPEFLLGVALGSAAGMLVYSLIRGLHLPRWSAALLAAVTFVAIVADVMDGLDPVTNALNQVGFNAGDTRISLLSVLKVAVALLVLFAVVRLASRIINHQIRRTRGLDPTQQLLAQKLAGVALLVAAFFIGIDLVGIDLTALAVFSGAVGLAIGFGLQKTFGNLIAGIILLMDRSIKPGDVIAVGDSFGSVNKIGVRAVSIITREAKEHLIPNELLMTEEVVNWSYSSRNVRISIPVGVAYDCDLPLAQRLMLEAATGAGRVLDNPPPKVWLRAFGESSVDHEIRLWIQDPEDGLAPVQSEVLNRLWVLFKENGIEIPFPQRDVRVKEWPAAAPAPPAGD
jgi:small-conductance mechanosensitive channel